MKIRLADITETGKEIAFSENVDEVNQLLAVADTVDYQFLRPVDVSVTTYRSGSDLFLQGRIGARVSGTCSRCLESYPFTVRREFAYVLKPGGGEIHAERELAEEDLALSFYEGEEVDLSPLVHEAMILSLPTRPLCREDCAGLCPQCGRNRNLVPCGCRDAWVDPRLAPLRSLKLPR